MPSFNSIEEGTCHKLLRNLNSANKVANLVYILKHLNFIRVLIAKYHWLSLSAILYVLSFNLTVAHSNLMF